MRVIVTGASGFVGSHLVRWLASRGVAGTAVARRRLEGLGAGWVGCDRASMLGMGAGSVDAGSVLVHLEVHHHVQRDTPRDLELFREVNVEGTRGWLDWCDRHGIRRFVFFSTIKAVLPMKGVTDETAEGPGDTGYGASKWEAEEVVRAWAARGGGRSAVIVRPAVVYGPGNEANMASLVRAIRRRRFVLVAGGVTKKSVVSVGNLCAAVGFLVGRMVEGVEVYNVTDAETPTVAELAGMIAGALGRKGSFLNLPGGVMRCAARVGDGIGAVTGRAFPLTTRRLEALLSDTDFSCGKLVRAGFVHPETTREGVTAMVASMRG